MFDVERGGGGGGGGCGPLFRSPFLLLRLESLPTRVQDRVAGQVIARDAPRPSAPESRPRNVFADCRLAIIIYEESREEQLQAMSL